MNMPIRIMVVCVQCTMDFPCLWMINSRSSDVIIILVWLRKMVTGTSEDTISNLTKKCSFASKKLSFTNSISVVYVVMRELNVKVMSAAR